MGNCCDKLNGKSKEKSSKEGDKSKDGDKSKATSPNGHHAPYTDSKAHPTKPDHHLYGKGPNDGQSTNSTDSLPVQTSKSDGKQPSTDGKKEKKPNAFFGFGKKKKPDEAKNPNAEVPAGTPVLDDKSSAGKQSSTDSLSGGQWLSDQLPPEHSSAPGSAGRPAYDSTSPSSDQSFPSAGKPASSVQAEGPGGEPSATFGTPRSPSNQRMSPSSQRMSPSNQRMSPSSQRMSPSSQRMSPSSQPGIHHVNQPVGHPPPGVYYTPPGYTYVEPGAFDAGARFDVDKPITIPPPPPGTAPNAAQLASAQGKSVKVRKNPNDIFTGGSDGGYTFM